MFRIIATKIVPMLMHDPRPALVAEILGMDQPGWARDPATHLALAVALLNEDPAAFADLMNKVDQVALGSVIKRGNRHSWPHIVGRPEISM